MDEFFYNPKGFEADDYDPRSADLTSVTLHGKCHYCTETVDYRIRYCISRVNMLKLVEILREEGYYRDSLYHALAYKFGKKMDDKDFSSFLDKNHIVFSRHFDTDPDHYSFEPDHKTLAMELIDLYEEMVPDALIGSDNDLREVL